ncbi:MAG: secE [Solirubrobacterales bacterium]|nr:secE [Solirubrobacterales bacterium]
MAKTRAQRKAEQRRRQAERARKGEDALAEESRAQHDTQVPETADVAEAELAEQGADLESLRGKAPAPSRADVGRLVGPQETVPEPAEPAEPADKVSRRARRAEERERQQRAKESERRRAPREAPAERQRGGVIGFLVSCWAELKRVQWPDRETLIQASAITLIFIAIMAAYLGILDAIFNWLVQRIL